MKEDFRLTIESMHCADEGHCDNVRPIRFDPGTLNAVTTF